MTAPRGRQGYARGSSGGRQGVATPASPQKSTTDADKLLPRRSFWTPLTPILQPRC